MPGAGHIVHMPSHIYQRVGRYADAVRSNQLAAEADEDYITQCRAQGLYPWATTRTTCTSSGSRRPWTGRVAIDAARKVAAGSPTRP